MISAPGLYRRFRRARDRLQLRFESDRLYARLRATQPPRVSARWSVLFFHFNFSRLRRGEKFKLSGRHRRRSSALLTLSPPPSLPHTMTDQKHLAYAVAAWLQTASKEQSGEASYQLKTASESVSKAFEVDLSDATQKAQYGAGPGLKDIWSVFAKTQAKMGSASAPAPSSSSTSGAAASTPAPKQASAEDVAKAESLKADGNKAMSSKDYTAAITAYTQAIEVHPTNPVYFSNRSAAYAQVGQLDKAIEDAKEASKVDPKFGKAYSRLGHALFSAGKYQEAVEAYEKGCEVDPTNATMKAGLQTAKTHATQSGASSTTSPTREVGANSDNAGGFPGMGGAGGAGGMPDLGALMNNPMIAQMAQNLMGNGGLEQMMNNPMIQQMMSRFGGGGGAGGGGMPDINAMMQDPQMREMAR